MILLVAATSSYVSNCHVHTGMVDLVPYYLQIVWWGEGLGGGKIRSSILSPCTSKSVLFKTGESTC